MRVITFRCFPCARPGFPGKSRRKPTLTLPVSRGSSMRPRRGRYRAQQPRRPPQPVIVSHLGRLHGPCSTWIPLLIRTSGPAAASAAATETSSASVSSRDRAQNRALAGQLRDPRAPDVGAAAGKALGKARPRLGVSHEVTEFRSSSSVLPRSFPAWPSSMSTATRISVFSVILSPSPPRWRFSARRSLASSSS
jgi:hypothetical protein